MNKYKELLQHLVATGDLTSDGDVFYKGELVYDVDDGESLWGFIGNKPTQYQGRKNEDVENLRKDWLSSGDPFQRQVANEFPEFFVFVDDQDQFDAMSDECEDIFRDNHNKWLRSSDISVSKHDERSGHALFPLMKKDFTKIDNHMFVSLGNFNFPATEGRDKWLDDKLNMRGWAEHIMIENLEDLINGGLGLG